MCGKQPKAVLLYSGGLDSILSCEALLRAGVELVCLRYRSIFYSHRSQPETYRPACQPVECDVSEEMVALLKAPRYGFGKNVNPCLDCKQMMYGKAWQEAQRCGADFIATGEVLGQRPKSQRAEAFRQMEAGAGVEGLVVRPLSARLLPLTIPEKEGLIHRERFFGFRGRSRKPQMQLARQWGISGYPTPAGGCKLTDPNFAERVRTLDRMGCLNVECLRLVRNGRLFPLGESPSYCFVLVGRNHEDNERLLRDAPTEALMLELRGRPGPLAALVGPAGRGTLDEAKRLVIRYSRFHDLAPEEVCVRTVSETRERFQAL